MLKLSVTVPSGGAPVVIQDNFPTEGPLVLEVATNSTATINLSFTQLGRISDQLKALYEAEAITFTLTAITGTDIWKQEADLAGLPEIYSVSESITIGGETGVELQGYKLVGGQIQAYADQGDFAGAVADSLRITCILPGQDGNAYSVKTIDSGSTGLHFHLVGTLLTIDLGGATSTAATVKSALNADAVGATFIAEDGGAGGTTYAIHDEVQFAHGVGTGLSVSCCGVACTVTAIDLSATPLEKITLTTPNVGSKAANNGYTKITLRVGEKKSDAWTLSTTA
jgi:hypothetical protein